LPLEGATEAPLESSTILVVDDHPYNLVALEAVLLPLGAPFKKATSGAEALRLLEQEDFAVALLDVRMPDMSGLEVAERLRQRANLTPIIFLTAADEATELRRQGYALGGVDFLLKPFDAHVLRAKVRVFVQLHEQRRELERLSRSYAADRLLAQQRVQVLASLAAKLSRLLTTDEVVELVLSEGSAQLHACASQLYLMSAEGDQLVLAGTRRALRPHGAENAVADAEPLPSLRFAASVAEPLWLQNREDLSQTHPLLAGVHGAEAAAFLPLRLGHRALGALLLCFPSAKGWDIAEQEFLLTLSAQVASALERARLVDNERSAFEELEKAASTSRLMADVGTLLSSSLDYEAVLRRLTELLVPAVADWCGVDVVDDQGNLRRIAAFHSDPQKVALALELDQRYPVDPSAPRGVPEVLRTGNPEWVAEIPDSMLQAAARDPEHLRLIQTLGLRSYVIVPLPARGRILGALSLVFAESGRRYGAEDVRLMQELAARAALSVDNALLFRQQVEARERLERQARQALLTGAVGSALAAEEQLERALQRCTEAVVQHLDAAFARIWTRNFRTDTLELQASAGLYTHLDGPHARVPVGQYKIGRIAQAAEPHLTNDVQSDAWISDPEWARREGMVAFAGYPLIIEGKVIGVLALFSRHQLASDALTALASIADAVAIGIERTQAARRARVERDTLEIVNQVGRALAAELDEDKLVQAIIDYGTRLAGAAYGSFFHQAALGAHARLQHAVSGLPDDAFTSLGLLDAQLFVAPLIAPGAGSRERILMVEDVRQDPRFAQGVPPPGMPPGHGVASYLAVTVVSRTGVVLGGLFFGHPQPGVFSERSQMLLSGVAAQAAIALDNARLFREAQVLIADLDKSNRDLDQFAYVASHDLKAPLRGISNLSQWLEEDLGEAITSDAKEQLRLMRNRVQRMEGLINGILDYSRAGRARTKLEAVAVDKLLTETIELCTAPESARVEIDPGMPTLQTERVPLQQVFMNLLGNALKHAKRSDPHVRVQVREAGERFEFSITDNGPGIAPEFHERIWGIFQTLEPRDTVEGTGIGLSVVKKIVESKRGQVALESQEGAGATFRFTWPKAEQEVVKSA
jgi:GAF domain-containing protein/anti-sigma regulatory factor (Ser/Thr protein kinase)